MSRIPRILHLCFGLAPDFGGKPWSLIHHACVMSAIRRLKPDHVYLYHAHEPSGPWWTLTRPHLDLVTVAAPQEIFGNPVRHVAHKADIIRLRRLLEHGGIYIDCDVLVHEDFEPLLGHSTVLGKERDANHEVVGLCNAVILAEPEAPFLKLWHDSYRSFRSEGPHDAYWNEHSVQIPWRLAAAHPDLVTILPHDAFHWPHCLGEDLARIYEPGQDLTARSRYANHLWESVGWWRYLRDLTPGRVRAVDSCFHLWVRDYVADLPDDYGAPSLAMRIRRKLREMTKQMLER
jgi:hypothetical protein